MSKLLLPAFALCLSLPLVAAEMSYEPNIAPASDEGQRAIQGMKVPDGMRIRLVAAEPLVANPVAFCFDEQGRLFVAETFRQKNAVVDNRDYMFWLDDDLAAMTVEDRLAYHQKHLKDKLAEFTKEHDRIRLLEDRDNDGQYETATVYSTGYHTAIEGTGAGVIARKGSVWYTNIPALWQLRDTNADGQADHRQALHHGYGVRVAFRGHDLHGLRFGPDGRLYFSIGDRGFNVKTPHRHYVYPDQGAVFRCDPDGANLEVVHLGLRNPQELAFDRYGQLFTGDNNSDSGDRARWVQVVEGGDSGWRMSFQYLSDRGPWNREKMWHPAWEGQPAFLVPPITNFADGPSGLTYDPGIGLSDEYRDHFFLCDFRGGPVNSGVRSFAMKPKGASFELVDSREFAWKILATDVEFGPDGAMYVSDWVNGWNGEGKGRIYRIDSPASESELARQAKTLLSEGFTGRSLSELVALLDHPSQHVRQEAQFELADRGSESISALSQLAAEPSPGDITRIGRLHALWALGQIARRPGLSKSALLPVADRLTDSDPHVRRVSAGVLGDVAGRADGPIAPGAEGLLPLLKDTDPQVRFAAAIAAGKLLGPAAIPALMEVLRENADRDPYLRHAGTIGLYHACNSQRDVLREPKFAGVSLLNSAMADGSPSVRMGALLVLRRYARPEVAAFLNDADPRLVEEAARAIHDVLIEDAVPALAGLADRPGLSEPTLWRVISANFRLGTPESAQRVARIVEDRLSAEAIRLEGLKALGDWAKPSGRDRVLGLWRPIAPRDGQPAKDALGGAIGSLFNGSNRLRRAAVEVAGRVGLRDIGPSLLKLIQDSAQPADLRVEALSTLALLNDSRVPEAIDIALETDQPALRAVARSVLARSQPQAALQLLEETLESGELIEKQSAFGTLGRMRDAEAVDLLADWLNRLKANKVPAEVSLDLLEAAERQRSDSLRKLLAELAASKPADPVSQYQESLSGGDADQGRRLFFEKAELSCVRCHKVGDQGGEVGPNLSSIGVQQKRDYILASLVDPNRDIARGFETTNVATVDGLVHTGIVKNDDGQTLTLITAEARLISIPKADIEEQSRGKSAMPEDLIKKMTRRELRDLVEFLARQKAKP